MLFFCDYSMNNFFSESFCSWQLHTSFFWLTTRNCCLKISIDEEKLYVNWMFLFSFLISLVIPIHSIKKITKKTNLFFNYTYTVVYLDNDIEKIIYLSWLRQDKSFDQVISDRWVLFQNK